MATAGPAGVGDQPRFRYSARLASEIELRWQDRWEAAWSKPAASGPTGFGARNVPAASQRSCQRNSISLASRAL